VIDNAARIGMVRIVTGTIMSTPFNIDAAVERKVRIARAGLYGFICGLMGAMVLLPLGSILDIFTHPALSMAGSALMYAGGACFIGTLCSFIVLIYGLLLSPREHDIRDRLTPSVSGFVLIFAIGVSMFVLIVVGMMMAGAIGLFISHRAPIFAALAYFIAGCAFFFLAHMYIMARGIITANEYPRWMAPLAKRLRTRDAADRFSPATDAKIVKVRMALSKAQIVLGIAIGFAFTFVTGASEYTDLLRPVIGSERAERAERVLGSTDALLWALTLFVFVFTSMFVVKTATSIIDFRRDRAMGRIDETYGAR